MNQPLRSCLPLCLAAILLGQLAEVHAEPLKIADGWSTNQNGGEDAITEAVSMVEGEVDIPRFMVLYTTSGYGEHEIAHYLRSRFPDAKLFGMDVFGGVFTSHGLHIGESGSLAILAFSGGNMDVGVGIRSIPNDAHVGTITKDVLKEAAGNAGHTTDDLPSVILLGAPKGKENHVVEAIADVFPPTVPLLGGTHCNNRFGPGLAIGNDDVCESGIVVALIYSNDRIGASFCSGFVGKKLQGRITAGHGRTLQQIDGRPALEVYNEWANGRFDDIDCSQQSVTIMSSALCPLARAVKLPDGDTHYIPVRPWQFHPDGSLSMGGDIRSGENIYYVETTKRALAKRPALVARDALIKGRIKVNNLVGGLFIYCAGAADTIGFGDDDGTGRMIEDVYKTMRGKPFIGGFSAGEQGNIHGGGFVHGNLMSSTVVFSK